MSFARGLGSLLSQLLGDYRLYFFNTIIGRIVAIYLESLSLRLSNDPLLFLAVQ